MINTHTMSARWGLDIVEFPPLRTSDNGWYYGVDGKPVGRGSDGERAARNQLNRRRFDAFTKRNWAAPDELTPAYTVNRTTRSGVNIGVAHPNLGDFSVWYSPDNSRIGVYCHPALIELADQECYTNPTPIQGDVDERIPKNDVSHSLWTIAATKWPKLFDLLEIEGPEPDDVEFKQEEVHELGNGFWSYAEGRAYWYTLTDEQLEDISHRKFKDMIDLFKVLGHNQVTLQQTYQPGSWEAIIGGIHVVARDEEQELTHTVKFKPGGQATIECGYVVDEVRFLEHEKRKIAGWMTAQADEFRELDLNDLSDEIERNE